MIWHLNERKQDSEVDELIMRRFARSGKNNHQGFEQIGIHELHSHEQEINRTL